MFTRYGSALTYFWKYMDMSKNDKINARHSQIGVFVGGESKSEVKNNVQRHLVVAQTAKCCKMLQILHKFG